MEETEVPECWEGLSRIQAFLSLVNRRNYGVLFCSSVVTPK